MSSFKKQLGDAIVARYTEHNSPVVGFNITTIKGWLGAVGFLFELIGRDSVKLIDGVEIKLNSIGNIGYQRTGESIMITFEPGIKLIFDAKIVRARPVCTGIALKRNQLQLILDGFPDLKIGLE